MTSFAILAASLWVIPLIPVAAFLGLAAFMIAAAFIVSLIAKTFDRRRKPVPIPVLGGKLCAIRLDGYTWDKKKDEFAAAIANFLSLDASALKKAEEYVFQYYKDCEEFWKSYDDEFKPIKSPGDVWKHVRFGSEPSVFRRRDGDKGIYIRIGCSCDWEMEHGMQIVFKNGLELVKVGSGDDSLDDVIYKA